MKHFFFLNSYTFIGDFMLERIKKYIVDDEERVIYFDNKVYIVNFIKILDINYENIMVRGKNKLIIIRGNNLSLRKLLEREVLISGDIKTIEVLNDK